MLATLSQFKTLRGISQSDTSNDTLFSMLLANAQSDIESFCDRKFELATYTEYYSGNGNRNFCLRQRPVNSIASLYLDLGGYYGQAPNAFQASSLLTPGVDYVLQYEEGGSTSGSGLVTRISGTFGGFTAFATNLNVNYTGGTLTQQGAMPRWPKRDGCIKVTYSAGYDSSANPSLVSGDLQQAHLMMTTVFYLTRKTAGQLYSGETLGKYSYTLRGPMAGEPPEMGTIRQILSRYREVSF